jgi:hypothetical protein
MPNEETLLALKESEELSNAPRGQIYNDVEEALRKLKH